MGMLLEAVDVDVDVTGALRWRWLLSDEETGNPLADHPVDLDPRSVVVARFRDLFEYTRHYAVPDRRTQDGARFLAEAGEWAGGKLLGGPIGAVIVADAPVTVRVRVPKALSPVLLWPLELAHVAGRPLATYEDVTLVYDIAPDAPAQRKAEPGAALRMLAVFSQPTQTSPLALRRERYALTRLVRRIAARERAVVELQVVQYGVTRERLRQIAGSGDGWDVLHLSGHGTGGAFWLEKADGSPDPVATGDLVALLRPARRRLRLAVASACESAADTTAQTLRLLGLSEQAEALETAENAEAGLAEASVTSDGAPAAQIPGLARALVRDLDCAVVAMRYPVTDEFAIAFGGSLYHHLLSRTHRHPVDVAVSRAVAEATGRTCGSGSAAPATRPSRGRCSMRWRARRWSRPRRSRCLVRASRRLAGITPVRKIRLVRGPGRCRWPTGCIPGSRRRSSLPPGRRSVTPPTPGWPRSGTGSLTRRASGRAGRTAAWWCGRGWRRPPYTRPEPRDIAISHHNLAIYLRLLGGDRAGQRAHRLAAALICRLTGMAHYLASTLRTLADELREDDDGGAGLPSTVAEVTEIAERTEGVRLGALLAALQPDPRAVQDALTEILRATADTPPGENAAVIASRVGQWEPVIAGIAAACQAGHEPPADLLELLEEMAKGPDWAALLAVLRRVLAGERGGPLLDGLDPTDTAIARETLARLT